MEETGKDLLDRWKYNIEEIGLPTKKKWRTDFRVDELDAYWEGFQTPKSWTGTTFLTINLIYANVKSQLDGMIPQSPSFVVKPSRSYIPIPQFLQKLDRQAILRENILNYLMRENEIKKEIKKCVLDAYPYYGVAKVYYKPYHEEHPKAGKPVLDINGEPMRNGETGEFELYPKEQLTKETFCVSRRNPSDILIDPEADSFETIKWIAERIEFTPEELRENPLFKNTEEIKPFTVRIEEKELEERRKKPDENSSRALTGGNASLPGGSTLKGKREIVYVWEIYDIEEGRIICYAEGHDKLLRDDILPAGIEGHPYVLLRFTERRNSPYPIPELFHQIGPQDEYNITRNQIVTHRKRFNRKYESRTGSVPDEELSKFEDPYDGMVIKTNTDGPAIRPIIDAGLDQAVYFDTAQLRRDFMDISGDAIPDSDIAKIEKASVAGLLDQRMKNRKGGKVAAVRDFVQEIGRKLMLLIENEMTLPLAISIAGEEGRTWEGINPKDLTRGRGEFSYEVGVSSLLPLDPETERTSWISLLQLLAMNPMVGKSPALIKKTAKMFGVEDQTLIQELVNFTLAVQKQQMLQGGQPGQPSMSGDMAKTLGLGG